MKRFGWPVLATFGVAIGLTGILSADLAAQTDVSNTDAAATTQSSAEQGSDSDAEMSVWMKKKLKYSQALLRNLAVGDFENLTYNARRLKLLNRVEGFVRRGNPEYRSNLMVFSRVVDEIERQAVAENIEGATLAFNQLTVSCVNCHRSLRSAGDAPAQAGNPTE